MIHKLIIRNHLNEVLGVDLRNPYDTGFLIYNIDGLGPGESDILVSDFALSDGGVFNSARRGARNIVITFRLGLTPTVEETRLRAYRYFALKRPINLTIQTGSRTGSIDGYVESVNPVIFTNDAHMQVSIICPDPNFYEVGSELGETGEIATSFYSVTPLFEFIYSSENGEKKPVGDIVRYEEGNVYYSGDVETGLIIEIYLTGSVVGLTLYDRTDQKKMGIDHAKLSKLTGKGLINGDLVTISTIPGDKSVKLLRDGVETNIINSLAKGSEWFTLIPGDNVFTFDATSGVTNVEISMKHRIAYDGL